MDTFAVIADERRTLADLLDGLDDEQWRTPSLCAGWTVREVAAHLITVLTTSLPKIMLTMASSRGDLDKTMDKLARKKAQLPTAEIVDTLRRNAEHRFTPPGMGPEAPLTDLLVHGQDIRRPLGITRTFPEAALRTALDFAGSTKSKGTPKSRIEGLRFEATDIGWSTGTGTDVKGTGEALLLAITGRRVALDELEGDGVATLRQRLA